MFNFKWNKKPIIVKKDCYIINDKDFSVKKVRYGTPKEAMVAWCRSQITNIVREYERDEDGYIVYNDWGTGKVISETSEVSIDKLINNSSKVIELLEYLKEHGK